MKILHLIHSVNPEGGGAIEAIRQSSRALGPLGHEVEIACLDAPDAPWIKEMEAPTYALGPSYTPYGISTRYTSWLRENIDHYDSVIINGVWQYVSYGAWRVAREKNVPYFVYPHGSLDRTLRNVFPAKHLKKAAMWMLAERRILDDANGVFYTSQLEMEMAERTFWPFLKSANGVVLPYCVGEPPDRQEQQKAAFRNAYPHLAKDRFCLFLSRVDPKKGCDLLIEAFSEIQRQQPGLHLVMAGPQNASYTHELKRIAAKRGIANKITWTGMLTGDEKWGALRSAEVFVLPTHQENFGIAIVEALSCGSPVVITDKTNIAPIIERHSAGIVGTDSAHSTLASLKKWFSLPQAAQDEMRSAARRCFSESFSALENARLLLRGASGELVGLKPRTAQSKTYSTPLSVEG